MVAILGTLRTGQGLQGAQRACCARTVTLKDVMINCTPITAPDAEPSACCFTLDVSDRVAAERTQALLAAVVESSDDAIVTKNLDRRRHELERRRRSASSATRPRRPSGATSASSSRPSAMGDEDRFSPRSGAASSSPPSRRCGVRKDGA